ncbi:General secretion pathway protein K, putative, partial [Ricinus communis]
MVVVLAASLGSDFLLMFRRVENQIYSEQAQAYLLGAEGVARAALVQDTLRKGPNDNLAEDWAKPQRFPTDYGWITGQLEDLEGRFNLNTLDSGTGSTNPQNRQFSEPQLVLMRLLQTLPLAEPLKPDQAQELVETITDWVDVNDTVNGLGGAESEYYARAEPPRLPANRALASPSELMWVKGMTPEIYRALAPLVTVWPPQKGAINLNTAPPAILASLNGPNVQTPLS